MKWYLWSNKACDEMRLVLWVITTFSFFTQSDRIGQFINDKKKWFSKLRQNMKFHFEIFIFFWFYDEQNKIRMISVISEENWDWLWNEDNAQSSSLGPPWIHIEPFKSIWHMIIEYWFTIALKKHFSRTCTLRGRNDVQLTFGESFIFYVWCILNNC